MGHRVLLTGFAALALALAGCTDRAADSPAAVASDARAGGAGAAADPHALVGPSVAMDEGAHAGLACARCHDGAALARATRAATDGACLDCHEDGGPATVSLGTISLEHREHGGADALDAGCASCHIHQSGELELAVTTTGCALCHAPQLDGATPEGCRLCHADPGHIALTSQGVPVVHSDLPWIGGECARCHYDVGRPDTDVNAATCAGCHRDLATITEQGAGMDLHPAHIGVACSSCHENVSHHIVAMSSGVRLSCTQCHATIHDVPTGQDFEPETCNACHEAAHAAEQRLMLGVAPADLPATPGDKFLVGLTCRSCHVQTADGATTRTNCVDCHSPEYATVLTWWERGSTARIAQVRQYVSEAAANASRASGAGSASARQHVASADSLIRFVQEGNPAHNLPLSHRALEEALARAAAAWSATGNTPPPAPEMGRLPRMGQCTYCHYEWREPVFQLDMPDAFHRRVMSRGEEAARTTGSPP